MQYFSRKENKKMTLKKRSQWTAGLLAFTLLFTASAEPMMVTAKNAIGAEVLVQEKKQPNTQVPAAPDTKQQPDTQAPAVPETEQQPDTQTPAAPETEQQPDTQAPAAPETEQQPDTQAPAAPETEQPQATELPAEPDTQPDTESVTEGTEILSLENGRKEREEKDLREIILVPKEKKQSPKVIEVSDLASLVQAVEEATIEDDLTPVYKFTQDSQAVSIQGEEQQMEAFCRTNQDGYTVPENVFAEDTAVDRTAITDGGGIVSLETVAAASDYQIESQDGTAALINPFQNKRLIVTSGTGFDPLNAVTIIQGYGDLYILDYDTEADTKAAYEYLQTIPGLSVETDGVISSTAEVTNTAIDTATDTATGTDTEQDTPAVTSRDIKVAVIDSGYDKQCGMERITDGTDMTGSGTIQDGNGHGTVMANIILEHSSTFVKIMPVKVSDANGRTTALKLYLGILYAAEHGADIINISMTAYQSTGAQIVAQAVKEARSLGIYVVTAAGNAGEDTAGYTPANVDEAITVSAINADETIDVYSNHGSSVDYCSFGAITVKGMGNQQVTATGTSAAAAIVSTVIAEVKRSDNELTYEDITALLNEQAKDLGDPGRDDYYGSGALTLDTIRGLEEDKNKKDLPALLTCDWHSLADDVLNELISETDYVYLRKFLDDLSKDDLAELLSRNVMFHNTHVTFACDENGNEVYRELYTLYDFLYSKDYDEYETQYYIYHANMTAKVKLRTNLNHTTGEITVYAPGIATNPVDDATYAKGVKVNGTSGGAVHVDKMSFKGFKTFTDDSGNENTIGQYCVQDVVIDKPQGYHLNMEKDKDGYSYGGNWWSKKYTPSTGSWTGGYTDPSAVSGKGCNTTSVTADFMVGEWDFEMKDKDGNIIKDNEGKNVKQLYTLNFQGGNPKISYGSWYTTVNPTCTIAGRKERSITYTCAMCGKGHNGSNEAEAINAYGHEWGNIILRPNNGIANGEQFEQCRRNCIESGWQRNFSYLQTIFIRYMNEDGNYNGQPYQEAAKSYCAYGQQSPYWSTPGDKLAEYVNKTVGGDGCPGYARNIQEDVPRKQYTIIYNGNGNTDGSIPSQTVCVGKTFHLSKNKFVRKGYLFQGWATTENGAKIYEDQQSVKNLTTEITITLHAVWKPITYTIHYEGNTATSGGTADSIHVYNEQKKLNKNGFIKDGYDFAGWSTTPDGSSTRFIDEEIIPQKEDDNLSDTDGATVTLYALWKCFNVTYFRNAFEENADDLMKEDLHHRYSEPYEVSEYEGNKKEEGFLSVSEINGSDALPEWEWIENNNEDAVLRLDTREELDEETGDVKEVPAVYSLAGWSVAPDSVPIIDDKKHFDKDGTPCKAYMEKQIVQEPQSLVDESIRFAKKSKSKGASGTPFIGEVNVSLNAIWDNYPVIHLTERYFTLTDAQAGKITPEEILLRITATDEEDGEGADKVLDPSHVRVMDYSADEIAQINSTGSFSLKLEAEDSAGNISQKMMKVWIVDTTAKEIEPPGEVRFISDKYYDDLPENSVWKADPEYKKELLDTFENLRYHEETAKIVETRLLWEKVRQTAPGSGGWKTPPLQTWRLDHEEILKLQDYVETNFVSSVQAAGRITEEYLQGVYDMLVADGCLIENNLPETERKREELKKQKEKEEKQQAIQEKLQENR